MTDEDDPSAEAKDADDTAAWEQRRRLAAVFGDVLPETTNDERDGAEESADGAPASDRWLKEQVPPHHG